MRFNPKARIDTGRVRDSGRSGGMGGGLGGSPMRIPMPSGKAGGGIGGVILLVLIFVLLQCSGLGGGGGTTTSNGGSLDTSRVSDGTDRYAECKTGDDANKSADCARVAVENSMTDFWADELGSKFQPEAALVTFTGQTQTGCGGATSQVGPFYCPSDQTIYLDTTFFRDVLQQQLGGPAGDFVEPYVLAHEYGHHIQNLLGTMNRVRTQQGPRSDAVRLELQADCYAGMWTKNATSTTDSGGEALITELSQDDIQTAIAAAKSVGDDRIQQQMQGRVSPESWTHGSAESRMKWFSVGYDQGSLQACDTWAVDTP
ncbi:MAG: neutral zinc metallopeptidase [Nocardioidaceae bacterium]